MAGSPVLELVGDGENCKPQDSSRESTPTAPVTAMVGHENSDSDNVVRTVFVVVDRLVTVLVTVEVLVIVSKGVQGACLSNSAAALRTAWVAIAALLLLLAVVLAGWYDRAQSVSSSSVALLELVTVMGTHVKSGASSGSSTSVTVTCTSVTVVYVTVVVVVTVAGGHGAQKPSEPQYAIDLQHSFVQQVSAVRHAPFGQHFSEAGM